MTLKASYPLLILDGWDVFYLTNEGSCKYDSTKKGSSTNSVGESNLTPN